MRRIQIHVEESVDNGLAVEARRRGMSKAALIRMLIEQGSAVRADDPLNAIVGKGDGAPVDDIDATVYGR